jgi:glycosyltransferase involved in cell wall biosynthesis
MTSKQLPPVSIVMIAYNEEKNIAKVIEEYYQEIFVKLPSKSEFIIYLDKPTDRTPQVVEVLAKHLNLKVIEGQQNLKYAGALKAALKQAQNELVFYSDSSGKHRAADFWEMVKYYKQYDIINGKRVNRQDPLVRRIATFIQRLFISIFFGMPIYDFNTGYKIMHKRVLDYLLPISNAVKYTVSTEFMIRAYKNGFKIKEVPVSFIARTKESKGTKFHHLFEMGWNSILGYIKIARDL